MTSSHARRWVWIAVASALVLSLAACGFSPRPAAVKQTFLLQAPVAGAPAMSAPRTSTLKVGAVSVAAPFRGKSLVYRQEELKYESDFYNEFFVPPGAMLSDGLSAYLSTAGVYKDVLPASANADGDFVLEVFVSELYGDNRIAGKPAAVLTARFFLIDNRRPGGVPVWQSEFKQRVAMTNTSAEALVAALNTAWSAMLRDLAHELAGLKSAP
jgi:cholesterol transport system auxiliary component